MNQPTEEQIKWFWEQCGFIQSDKTYHHELTKKVMDWLKPDGSLSYNSSYHKGHLLPIDLNNLFKYAVPKVYAESITFDYTKILLECRIKSFKSSFIGEGETEELSLFWAIYKTFGGKPYLMYRIWYLQGTVGGKDEE